MQQQTGPKAPPGRQSLTLSEHLVFYNVQFFFARILIDFTRS